MDVSSCWNEFNSWAVLGGVSDVSVLVMNRLMKCKLSSRIVRAQLLHTVDTLPKAMSSVSKASNTSLADASA